MSEPLSRAQEVKRRHLELLQEENAFVDENEALRRKRSRSDKSPTPGDASAAGGDDDEDDSFLGSLRASSRWRGDATLKRRQSTTTSGRGGSGGEFPKRLHLAKVLQDEHEKYLATIEVPITDDGDADEDGSNTHKGARSSLTTSSATSNNMNDSLFVGNGVAMLPTDEHILTAFVAQRKMLEAWLAAEQTAMHSPSGAHDAMTSLVGPPPSFLSTFFTPHERSSAVPGRGGTQGSSKHAPPRPSSSRHLKAPGGSMLCAVCLKPGSQYVCVRCGVTRYCSADCHDVHDEMRCLKHVM